MDRSGADQISVRQLAVYGVFFVCVLYFIFSINSSCLFLGLDGASWISGFQAQAMREPFSQLGVDPQQGNFDAYYPALREYFLPTALSLLLTGADAEKAMTFTVYGALMMATTYTLARTVGFSREVAALGGVLFASAALPTNLSGWSWMYGIYNIVPHLAQVVALTTIIVACFWRLQSDRFIIALGLALIAVTSVVISAASFITMTLLMSPTIIAYGGASIFVSRRLSDVILRCLVALTCLAVPVALGMAHYAVAVGGYTAYNFFAAEFLQARGTLAYASILYNPGITGKAIWVLGLAGAAYAAFAESGKVRLFAWTHILTIALFQIGAYLVVIFAHNYHGPSPLYFEFFIWPIILIFVAFAVSKVWGAIVFLVGSRFKFAKSQITLFEQPILLGIVPIALMLWSASVLISGPGNVCAAAGFSPIRPNAVTETLEKTTATKPGMPFRGLAATFNGIGDKSSLDWFSIHGSDAQLWRSIGNDLRLVGLWAYGIPTLFQYSPLLTPPYYLLLTEFLSRREDQQLRSVLVLTAPNEPMLKLWGVRFLIADRDLPIGKTRTQLALHNAPQPTSIRLVELAEPNLGGYSPTQVHQVVSFREALKLMHNPGYDGQHEVITDAHLPSPLVAATDAKLVYQKFGFTVSAVSHGRSILVLPVQYSRCWTASGAGDPALFRANMMQLGILFTGQLDIRLVFRFGPFFASECRIEDIRDMERLAIRNARMH